MSGTRDDAVRRLTGCVRRLPDSPEQSLTLFNKILKDYSIHPSELHVTLDATKLNADQEIARLERLEELRNRMRGVPWDEFLMACSTKVDIRQTYWRPLIAKEMGVPLVDFVYRQQVGSVPPDWFDKLRLMEDVKISSSTSNFAEVGTMLAGAIDRPAKWVADQFNVLFALFNGMQITASDVTQARTLANRVPATTSRRR